MLQDTVPPQLSFVGQLPEASSAAAIASFSYSAADVSSVDLLCRLSVQSSTSDQGTVTAMQEQGPQLDTPVELGQWSACNDSITFYWLLPG